MSTSLLFKEFRIVIDNRALRNAHISYINSTKSAMGTSSKKTTPDKSPYKAMDITEDDNENHSTTERDPSSDDNTKSKIGKRCSVNASTCQVICEDFTTDQIYELLLLNHLPVDWVIKEKIDGMCFPEIDHIQLKQWGILNFGERCSILRYQRKVKSTCGDKIDFVSYSWRYLINDQMEEGVAT